MIGPDLRPLCLACGGVVVEHGDGETGTCPVCGPVQFTGMPGDIDLTRASPPRYVPAAPPVVCLLCGAVPVADDPPPGADAACKNCGPVCFVVERAALGKRVQGYRPLDAVRPQDPLGSFSW